MSVKRFLAFCLGYTTAVFIHPKPLYYALYYMPSRWNSNVEQPRYYEPGYNWMIREVEKAKKERNAKYYADLRAKMHEYRSSNAARELE
jgi:hypothetical protein